MVNARLGHGYVIVEAFSASHIILGYVAINVIDKEKFYFCA